MRRRLAVLAALVHFIGLPAGIAQATPVADPDYSAYVLNFQNVASYQSMGQTFIAASSGTLGQVGLGLTDYAATGTLVVTIETVNGSHLPTGTILATATLGNADVPNSPLNSVVSVTFTSPATVTSGTEYAIVLRSAAGTFGWADSTTFYTGHPRVWDNGTWQVLAPGSATASFAVYVTPFPANESPAPVLQQVGLPGSGSCADVTEPSLNWGGSSSGGWGQSWAMWPNGGSGGAVCTRTLVYVPVLGHWVAT